MLTINRVIAALEKLYDPPKSFLTWKTPLNLLIATILSAQCTDVRVNIVTKDLFKKFRKAEDYLAVPPAELEHLIHSCGTYHAKARYIRGVCRMIIEKHGGKVPQTMEEMIELPGVGRKTAAIILYAAFGKQEGIAVDTHVMRLSLRLGLTRQRTPQKIELDLMEKTPRAKWGELNTLMISHGRAVCTARDRKCEVCVFKNECPSSRVRGKRDRAKERR